MPTRFSVTLKAKTAASSTNVKGEFSDEEWNTLTSYAEFARELRTVRLLARVPPWSFAFGFDQDAGYALPVLPDKIEVRELAMVLRPFLLQKEPTHFYRVVNILAKRMQDPAFRQIFDAWRARFSGKDGQQQFRFEAAGIVLNSEEALNLWLNAFEYHRDADKRKVLEQVGQSIPFEIAEGLFVEMLICEAEAVLLAAALIEQIAASPTARGDKKD